MQKLHALFVAIWLICAAAVPAGAQTPPPHPAEIDPALVEYSAARERIGATSKVALGQCEALAGPGRIVCIKEARGREKIALAELDQQRNPSDANARRLAETKLAVNHEIAVEKCNDRQGGDKAECLSRASADESKARAGIKAGQ
ncbi:hypothetical protein ASC78_10500 [Variovorax sp. Root318D1]|nr:hypothetical protein ASC78_10500 [Variovorax sp. Root318D1]